MLENHHHGLNLGLWIIQEAILYKRLTFCTFSNIAIQKKVVMLLQSKYPSHTKVAISCKVKIETQSIFYSGMCFIFQAIIGVLIKGLQKLFFLPYLLKVSESRKRWHVLSDWNGKSFFFLLKRFLKVCLVSETSFPKEIFRHLFYRENKTFPMVQIRQL